MICQNIDHSYAVNTVMRHYITNTMFLNKATVNFEEELTYYAEKKKKNCPEITT